MDCFVSLHFRVCYRDSDGRLMIWLYATALSDWLERNGKWKPQIYNVVLGRIVLLHNQIILDQWDCLNNSNMSDSSNIELPNSGCHNGKWVLNILILTFFCILNALSIIRLISHQAQQPLNFCMKTVFYFIVMQLISIKMSLKKLKTIIKDY